MSGYKRSLEAAGADIIEFKEFGSYQGDWFAVLSNYDVIQGSYGSCSECDAFEGEFGYGKKMTYEALVTFGERYLSDSVSIDALIKRYQRKSESKYSWDDDKDILNWLRGVVKNRI
jgi:hypothetical protein